MAACLGGESGENGYTICMAESLAVRLETTGIINWLRDGGLFTKSGPTLVTL